MARYLWGMRITHLFLLIAPLCAFGQPPPGYYDAAAGLSGDQLRTALRDIIAGHTVLDYGSLWNYFPLTDHREGSTSLVWDMYSDVPGGTPPYQYVFGTSDQCGNYDSEGDCFNREHSFPKSWFGGDAPPMNSDLHHLYPTDGYVNNKRGELPFGRVGSADWTGQNGSRTGMNISQGYNGTVFEPLDAYKGDLARAHFYMLTRYWGQTASWSSPGLQSGDLAQWYEALLLTWHASDPVSEKEMERNNIVFAHQHNRNPFIDNPQWVQSIWGPVASVQELDALVPSVRVQGDELIIDVPYAYTSGGIELFDTAGRVLHTGSLAGSSTRIPLQLSSGHYVALVTIDTQRHAKRFVR